jgi:predicted Zn finger-like uncharacterized protein
MSKIRVICPNCKTRYRVDEAHLGKKAPCQVCSSSFELRPAEAAAAIQSSGSGQWLEGKVILEDFAVQGKLGQGGFGEVYLVRSRSTDRLFAVKRARFRDAGSRSNFLAELQTWIDLPEHPHLVPCRFFRTVDDEVLIFADYVDGGTLAVWVRDRKLTRLEQILDVTIQTAWGLQAVHDRGLVHQDYKPGNVLMTAGGIARVTDFGLARAKARSGETAEDGTESILVSVGGRTPAYCSPEQARKQPISRKTDQWSWGVAVLEMFVGGPPCKVGPAAPHVMAAYLGAGPGDPRLPAMPRALADLLKRCFRQDPAERWPSMASVVEVLMGIYRDKIGHVYPRPAPAIEHRKTRPDLCDWKTYEPRDVLIMALQAEGRDVTEADSLLPPRAGSPKAQAVADLATYEEAQQRYERLIETGSKALVPTIQTGLER